ncbi:MAG: heavy metal-associated domain-containing protein [Bacteroidota bacterium]
MKNYLVIMLMALVLFSCKNQEAEVKTIGSETAKKEKVLNPNATYAKAEFKIEGMTCAMGCAKAIEKKMAKMDGVKTAKVDFERELAMVEYDEEMVTPNSLEEAVAKAGKTYKVKEMKTVDAFSENSETENSKE